MVTVPEEQVRRHRNAVIAEIAGVLLGLFVVYDTARFIGNWGSATTLDIVTLALAYFALAGVLYVAVVLSRPMPHRGG